MRDEASDAVYPSATHVEGADLDCPDAAGVAGHRPLVPRTATCTGNLLPVLSRTAAVARGDGDGAGAVLAVVLDTRGSTYARAGTLALFTGDGHLGWLSGGCLEPEIRRQATLAAEGGGLRWLEIDTRDDAALFSGAATGCRGRLHLALIPLHALPGLDGVLDAWLDGRCDLVVEVDPSGRVGISAGNRAHAWQVPASPPGWPDRAHAAWRLRLGRPPSVLVAGSGPEAPILLPLLGQLGWRCVVVERRPAWRDAHLDDAHLPPNAPAFERIDDALAASGPLDAALVMHHNFEMDRDALEILSRSDVGFVGLLGPARRRDDLLRLLHPTDRMRLRARLRSPVGLPLGGQGPEAIAVSICAQLQSHRHAGA